MPEPVYENLLSQDIARTVLEDLHLPLIVFHLAEERILRWIP